MKNLSLLMMLLALLLTACSDSDNGTEDPNGGGETSKGKIVGLNIKDAKLIYGVGQSTAKAMLKSSGSSNYFRQVTKENKNLKVNWVTESGDTTSVIRINAMANLNEDYIIINVSSPLDNPDIAYNSQIGYIVNKNTGMIINPENSISNVDLVDGHDYTAFYDKDRYCYVKALSGLLKIDLQTYEITTMFEGSDDIKILSYGAYFAHMRDGNHKYGNLKVNTEEDFFEDYEEYKGYDNYIPVYGTNDKLIIIICNKKNSDGTTNYSYLSFTEEESVWGYGFSDNTSPEARFNSDFELPANMPIGYIYLIPTSVVMSISSEIIYIGTSDGAHGILMELNMGDLRQLPNDLIGGFISGKRYHDSNRDVYPNIANNSMASFNSKDNGDLIITEFGTFSQKTIKDAKGYRISAVLGKYKDDKPVTFIGDNWEINKQCVGTIDSKGNAEILQEFNSGDNEAMNGFLLELN